MNYVNVLEACIEDAPNNEVAESLLRSIVQGAAVRAPVSALVELGELLVKIRDHDMARRLESN